jgi:hypothetical protein
MHRIPLLTSSCANGNLQRAWEKAYQDHRKKVRRCASPTFGMSLEVDSEMGGGEGVPVRDHPICCQATRLQLDMVFLCHVLGPSCVGLQHTFLMYLISLKILELVLRQKDLCGVLLAVKAAEGTKS